VVDWPDRTIYFQWHRGDAPELNRACAALSQNYKLVQPLGSGDRSMPTNAAFELYNYVNDPLERKNIAADYPNIVNQMRRGYEAWFKDVTSGRDYSVPPRIYVGAPEQKEVLLTRQDWRGKGAGWTPKSVGHWYVDVRRAANYEIALRFAKAGTPSVARLKIGSAAIQKDVKAGESEIVFPSVRLPKGPTTVEAVLSSGNKEIGMNYVELRLK